MLLPLLLVRPAPRLGKDLFGCGHGQRSVLGDAFGQANCLVQGLSRFRDDVDEPVAGALLRAERVAGQGQLDGLLVWDSVG